MRRLFAVLLTSALLLVAASCGDDASSKGSQTRPADSSAEARPTVGPATVDWAGRSEIKACAEDPTSTFTTQELAARLQAPFTTAVSLVSRLPASLVSPCPYDYPAGELTVHDSVNAFTYQIYLSSTAAAPSAEILEQWLPAGRDTATPVTFRLTVPVQSLQDLGGLLRWFSTVIGPEPTTKH